MIVRVLLTNTQLASRSGTEMYVHDLAIGLIRRGHAVTVYSPRLGELARLLAEASVSIVDCLDKIAEPPDVIHGHHSLETMAALLHFPAAPGIFVCHDCSAWFDTPPRHPRIRRYVAVDYTCRERLTQQHAIPPDRVRVLYNSVDLKRFRQRSALPERPRRALMISNYADYRTVRPVRQACSRAGISLDTIGLKLGGICERPEQEFGSYELAFAKGRCAWEALAVGCAVIVCDAAGVGEMVTSAELDELKQRNFGRRLLSNPVCSDIIYEQIQRYDANDATLVSHGIRATAGIDSLVDQLCALYREAIDEVKASPAEPITESQAAADFLGWWAVNYRELVRQQAKRYRGSAIAARLWQSLMKRLSIRRSIR